MIQFYDIVKPWECPKQYGETLEDWRERMVTEYTPKFKELTLFNDSAGNTKRPIHEVLKEQNFTLDDFCEGYVKQCFEGIDEETFEMLPEGV